MMVKWWTFRCDRSSIKIAFLFLVVSDFLLFLLAHHLALISVFFFTNRLKPCFFQKSSDDLWNRVQIYCYNCTQFRDANADLPRRLFYPFTFNQDISIGLHFEGGQSICYCHNLAMHWCLSRHLSAAIEPNCSYVAFDSVWSFHLLRRLWDIVY